MLVIVTEAVPDRLRGRLAVYMLEVRSGVFVARLSARVRDMLWKTVEAEVGDGNAVMVWTTNTESGYDVMTCGTNRRVPKDFDGLKLVEFHPLESEEDED